MFFEMNLSCHPPVIYESEHKTDREGRKLSLESILRMIQHEPFSKRQVWRELSGSCGTVRGICQPAGQSPLSVSQRPAPQPVCGRQSLFLFCLRRPFTGLPVALPRLLRRPDKKRNVFQIRIFWKTFRFFSLIFPFCFGPQLPLKHCSIRPFRPEVFRARSGGKTAGCGALSGP